MEKGGARGVPAGCRWIESRNRALDWRVTRRRPSVGKIWGGNGSYFGRLVRLPVELRGADPVPLQLLEQGRLGDPELARRLRLVPHLAGEFAEDVRPLRLLPAREPGRALRFRARLRRLPQEGEIRSRSAPRFPPSPRPAGSRCAARARSPASRGRSWRPARRGRGRERCPEAGRLIPERKCRAIGATSSRRSRRGGIDTVMAPIRK